MKPVIEISKLVSVEIRGERSDAIALFDATVNGFNLRKGKLRRRHADGHLFVTCSGRSPSGAGIGLPPGPVYDALSGEVAARYSAEGWA